MMAEQAPVSGQRTIRHEPDKAYSHLWQGEIDNKAYIGRHWRDSTPERVEKQMNQALGEVPTSQYDVIEKR